MDIEKFLWKIRGTENPMVSIRSMIWSGICCLGIWVLLSLLIGCSSGEPLPPIEGPWYQLNNDRWQPSEAELQHIKELPEK
jgi:hypothetical protein